jgi:SsrA-binding protein
MTRSQASHENDRPKRRSTGEKLIATNPIARSNFSIESTLEAGLVLTGTEIKSIRAQSPNLRDGFVEVSQSGSRFEAWLVNTHIAPYSHGNIWNHEPLRRRKLLLHAKEIERLWGALTQRGMTIVPTRMYFKDGLVKIEIGVGKGKNKIDKRDDIKSRSAEREMDRAMKHDRRKK